MSVDDIAPAKVPLHKPVPQPKPNVWFKDPGLTYGLTEAEPDADAVPLETISIVIVKEFVSGTVITWNVPLKFAATKPVGAELIVNVNKSPISNPCPAKFTVTVAEPLTVLKVAPVKAVSKGVIS